MSLLAVQFSSSFWTDLFSVLNFIHSVVFNSSIPSFCWIQFICVKSAEILLKRIRFVSHSCWSLQHSVHNSKCHSVGIRFEIYISSNILTTKSILYWMIVFVSCHQIHSVHLKKRKHDFNFLNALKRHLDSWRKMAKRERNREKQQI